MNLRILESDWTPFAEALRERRDVETAGFILAERLAGGDTLLARRVALVPDDGYLILAANTSMRGVEVKNVRRKDFDAEKRIVHIRASKNETSNWVIPLNDSAFDAVQRMVRRADLVGHTEPTHYLWCASQHHQLDPTKPASKWDTAWRVLRDAASLPGLRFHDLRHTVVTRLLEAGEPDHVVESITGHLSRRMLEHYSHIRLHPKKQALDRLDRSGKAALAKTAK
jgi:integrase